MKKLFTLFALLAVFMGARAEEVVDAEVDFSKFNDISEVPFASWRGSESAFARLSLQDGCLHFHSEEATDPSWDCQFYPIGGVNAEIGVTYTLHFKIKGTVAKNVSMLGFGQTPYGQFAITTDWVEGTVDYEATSADGNILMQCGDYVGEWDIAYLKITHEQAKETRPVEWKELLTNGDAESPWEDPNVAFNDKENNFKICAWGKEKGRNLGEADDNGNIPWNPFPCDIEEVDGSKVFVVHGQVADTEGDASAWDNQFWIEAPRRIAPGEALKVHFRYKASENASTGTQIHHQNPSDYMHWDCIGNINFTTEWQEYDQQITWKSGGDDQGWSICFNLNNENKNAVNFYFDDLSIQEMVLDHGFFVASSNASTGIEYDYDNAIEFTEDGDLLVATVGTAGKQDTWVNEVQISTIRGHRGSFLGATIKPVGIIDGTEDGWLDYESASNYKIKLPAAGVYTIYIAPEDMQIVFVKVEGEENKEPIEVVANPTEVVVKGQERDDLADSVAQDGTVTVNEEEGGEGQPWDNQFFIVANRNLSAGEVTVISFKYKSSVPATSGTQLHGDPGAYMHWNAIGSFNFTEEWQDFEKTLTIPNEADGMKSIAFNMAEIKGACDYYIKDVIWKLEDNTESLINMEGADNFYVKEGAGTTPYIFGTDPNAINSVVNNNTVSTAAYNLAGQRVSGDYKGIVVKNGKKYMVK